MNIVEDIMDVNGSSRGSQFLLVEVDQLALNPVNRRWHKAWERFMLVWAFYSLLYTPLEFGFFRGLPRNFVILDITGQVVFLVDIVVQLFVANKDTESHIMTHKHTPISLRYLKTHFLPDLLGCVPWDAIYKAVGEKEEVRYMLWIRLTRARKVYGFLTEMENNISIDYLISRIIKLIAVKLYCSHTAACIFYYLATTLPEAKEGYTWIGSLKLGDYSYIHFRNLSLWMRYTTSMYGVGGNIHAVNLREMIFSMMYCYFNTILGVYLNGNMAALIIKGSKTERYREKLKDLIKYMKRNGLGKDLRNQIKQRLHLQYKVSYTTNSNVIKDIPISIRSKISQTLYKSYVENVHLFKGCSEEFINQIVTRVHEETFLPGEVILEQGNVVDQLYIICHGSLEEVSIGADGSEERESLELNSLLGEISILCNIPQPYTVRVCEQLLCRLLRIDKQSFTNILEIYFLDGRKVLTNLLERNESNIRLKKLESDILTSCIGKLEAELALKVNSAAYYGDFYQLKSLIRGGADPNIRDYDGRSALHVAASRGHADITLFLIEEGLDINAEDNFGTTPLFEAIKSGNDTIASLLKSKGGLLKIANAGSFLCMAVARGDSDLLQRLLSNGIDPNEKDYDHRTPLHIAASQGLYLMTKLLLAAGASVFSKDIWGNTPLSEGKMCGNDNLIIILEEAKRDQISESRDSLYEVKDSSHPKKCTVFRRQGVVIWVPHSIDELIKVATTQLEFPAGSCILSEEGGRIFDVSMIEDGQKLYIYDQ